MLGNLLQEFYRIDEVGEIRQCGLIAGIELVANPKTRAPFPWEARTGHRVAVEARKRGALLRPLGDTIVLMPPLAISERDLARLVAITLESVRDVLTK